MGLKYWWNYLHRCRGLVKIRPKWDWNHGLWMRVGRWILLKSDQNGIEIKTFQGLLGGPGRVKIRPKWDWNTYATQAKKNSPTVKIRPKWDWNLEDRGGCPPPPELKSDQNGIEIHPGHAAGSSPGLVKIRPKWDWNPWMSVVSPHSPVKIRPKWDWNEKEAVNLEKGIMLKSDQNGIEINHPSHIYVAGEKLKSDQNGIEMGDRRLSKRLTWMLKSDQNGIEIGPSWWGWSDSGG